MTSAINEDVADEILPIRSGKTDTEIVLLLEQRVKEVESLCNLARKTVEGQIARSATLTEVTRFIARYAPEHGFVATQKLLGMYDNDDDWWIKMFRDKAIWQWASELVPQYAGKWEEVYETKYGRRK